MNELLGREPVELDMEAVSEFLNNQVVLVTGAGGSIGSELCRQVCRFSPKKLVLVDNAETPLFDIEQELKGRVPTEAHLCDVRLPERVEAVWAQEKPDIVLHAAAYKHVPMLERHPEEALGTNFGGSAHAHRASRTAGCKAFVLLSTDKAIQPTSIMGATKRAAELYCCTCPEEACRTVAVRFGNVLDSRGSVVPTFRRQIESGGPVTVTDSEMKRYFMTIPEAAQLVLQAAALGESGRIYLLDMGEPVKIVDLARQMIALSGKDIDIEFTGARPGERLFEPLDYADTKPTAHPKVFAYKDTGEPDWDAIRRLGSGAATVDALLAVVPEYTPQGQGEQA